MNPPLYIDTSGLAKLVLNETEGPTLRNFVTESELTMVSSELTEVELVRAVAKADTSLVSIARDVLDSIVLLPISGSVRVVAGELFPGRIRSLDAIHLSTALEIESDLAGLLTYDHRMAELAQQRGIQVLAPK